MLVSLTPYIGFDWPTSLGEKPLCLRQHFPILPKSFRLLFNILLRGEMFQTTRRLTINKVCLTTWHAAIMDSLVLKWRPKSVYHWMQDGYLSKIDSKQLPSDATRTWELTCMQYTSVCTYVCTCVHMHSRTRERVQVCMQVAAATDALVPWIAHGFSVIFSIEVSHVPCGKRRWH